MLGVPVWEHDGIICTGETYKAVVKLTFAKGASLEDPAGLFNSSLEGNVRRAIDIHEGDRIDDKGVAGAHSRRRGTEHVGASCRSRQGAGGPLPEATKERLSSAPPSTAPRPAKAGGRQPAQSPVGEMRNSMTSGSFRRCWASAWALPRSRLRITMRYSKCLPSLTRREERLATEKP